jgi:hypothetical protein
MFDRRNVQRGLAEMKTLFNTADRHEVHDRPDRGPLQESAPIRFGQHWICPPPTNNRKFGTLHSMGVLAIWESSKTTLSTGTRGRLLHTSARSN